MPATLADLLAFVIPEPEKCKAEAASLAADHAKEAREQVAHHAVTQAKRWAMAAGSATGAIASPLIMLPAALADMAAVLRIEGQMAGTVGALLDPISLNDAEGFRADVLTIVFPGMISQALRQLGLRAGQRLTQQLIRRYMTQGLVESASRLAAKRLLLHVSERAIMTKTVPLVGAGIGAGWNWLELQAVGNRAIRYYQQKSISPTESESPWRALLRRLPWRGRE
ncbi:MAG TPA: hypothetical protein VHP11_15895 [Tepidisphaeraceae bacterium]|nr:hypothetical protein [Tepidisphaeraceae bacterium]